LPVWDDLTTKAIRREGLFYCVFRNRAKALSFAFSSLYTKSSYGNRSPSPDRSGNPFAFSFKKQKIGAHSGIKLLILPKDSTPLSRTKANLIVGSKNKPDRFL
jgi:hypothetical protein